MRSMKTALLTGGLLLAGTLSYSETHISIYVPVRPPIVVHEVRPVAPEPRGYVWVPGYHRWDGNAYVWVGGRWDRPPHGRKHWYAGTWRHDRRHGYYWVEGHWR